jgi:hypothetical protein
MKMFSATRKKYKISIIETSRRRNFRVLIKNMAHASHGVSSSSGKHWDKFFLRMPQTRNFFTFLLTWRQNMCKIIALWAILLLLSAGSRQFQFQARQATRHQRKNCHLCQTRKA